MKNSIPNQSCENKIKPDQYSNTEYFIWLLSIIFKHTDTQKTLKNNLPMVQMSINKLFCHINYCTPTLV